jgi:hypothetical protein
MYFRIHILISVWYLQGVRRISGITPFEFIRMFTKANHKLTKKPENYHQVLLLLLLLML